MEMLKQTSIANSLESEFRGQAQSERDEKIRQLTEFANLAKDPLPVKEGGMVLIVTCSLVVALIAFAATAQGGNAKGLMGMMGGAALLAIFVLFLIRKYGRIALTLGHDGVRIGRDQEALLPWTAFDDYRVVSHSINGFPTAVEITFDLVPGYTPPPFRGGRFMRYVAKKNKIMLRLNTLKGMNGDYFAEAFGRYWQGGLARLELLNDYGVSLPV